MSSVANPFTGPRPLQRGERLHGRGREVRELFYLLGAERIVWLYSPSGAGKTSLVQAGLVPRLEDDEYVVWPTARVGWEPPAGSAGNRYVRSVLLSLEEALPAGRRTAPEELGRLGIAEYVERRRDSEGEETSLVLVLDQLEEMITADPLGIEAKGEFFEQLGKALWDPNLWALFVLREDYLGAFDPYVDVIPTRMGNTFRLGQLDREAAREAIVDTAEDGGREFPAAERLVRDLARVRVQRPDGSFEEAVGHHVEPVQLQVVCRRLWEAIPEGVDVIEEEHLERFGDVSEALGHYYADSVAEVAGGDAALARTVREWFGERLIRAGGVRGQVLRGQAESEGLANEVIEKLLDTHLIRAEKRAGAVWYEIAHDRLVDPVVGDNAAWQDEHLSEVQRRAALWERQGRPAGLLLVGAELDAGEAWAAENASLATAAERRFLDASREARAAAERERRQVRRIRRLAVTATIVGTLALAAGAVAGWQWWEAEHQKRTAIEQTEKARDLARAAIAGNLLADGRTTEANLVALEIRRPDETPTAPEVLRDVLDAVLDRPLVLEGHEADVVAVSFSPDGSLLTTASADGTARIWDSETGEELATLEGHSDAVTSVAVSPDGSRLATASRDRTARLWDAGDGTGVRVLSGHADEITAVAFSPDGSLLATASADKTVRTWDVARGETTAVLDGYRGDVLAMTFHSEGLRVVTAAQSPDTRIWNAATGTTLRILEGHTRRVTAAAFSADGSRVATASHDRTARLWDSETGEALATLEGHEAPVTAVTFSPDGSRVATTSDDDTARVWDTATGALLATLRGHRYPPIAVSFDGGSRVATGSLDRTARIWETARGEALVTLRGHAKTVLDAAFSADGSRVVTASEDSTARIWDSRTGQTLVTLAGHGDRVLSAAWSRGGDRVVTASADGTAKVWDAATGAALATLRGHRGAVVDAAFDPGGSRVATASWDGTARIWDAATGEAEALLEGHTREVTGASFSSDGARVLTASWDGTARTWSAETGEELSAAPSAGAEAPPAASFHPNGTLRLTFSDDETARIWAVTDEPTHLLRGRIRARTRECLPAAFSEEWLGEEPAEAERREAACRACLPGFFDRIGRAEAVEGSFYVEAWLGYEECKRRERRHLAGSSFRRDGTG